MTDIPTILDVPEIIILNDTASKRYKALRTKFVDFINAGVSYVKFSAPPSGNSMLELEVPANLKHSIRLVPHVDFNDWTIKIKNNCGDVSLFDYEIKDIDNNGNLHHGSTHLHVTKEQVDSGDFSEEPVLSTGKKLLIVKDLKEWAYRTDSNDTKSYYRSDTILIKNGRAVNKPIAPYNTPSTVLDYEYYDLDLESPGLFENLTILRDASSLYRTLAFSTKGHDDITFNNITVAFTGSISSSDIINDMVFHILDCSNVKFNQVRVYETYSKYNKAGYAFFMSNVFNSYFKDVTAYGNWGVFGTHYLNRVHLENCDLNRFDIHGYGKDVICIKCKFHNDLTYTINGVTRDNPNRNNQLGAFYGTISFFNCEFSNFFPLLIDPSYHAYTGFDFAMYNCILKPNPENAIIKIGKIESEEGKRTELKKICWPNIHIINLTLEDFNSGTNLLIFKTTSTESEISTRSVAYISEVSVSLASSSGVNILFANSPNIRVENEINFKSTHDGIIVSNLPTQVQM